MPLYLHNTLTRQKEEFQPLDPGNVRMYVCGPTVYDYAHIGNARPAVVFDVLYRVLKALYATVTYARNFTDVDDKINAKAKATGEAIGTITARTTQAYLEDMGALGVLEPDVQPRATQHIAEMIAMIETLIAKGHAYAADGHVLFSVPSMPDYGQLSRRNRDELIAGARVEVAPYKKDAADFVLWKPSEPDIPGWDSPWGRGRPGWHIECSAMSAKYLGETFDIHGGGLDLIFPHHENEIAQSCCAFGSERMANVWMHNGFLQVEGRKMSKSEGNFVTIHELLTTEKFGGRKWPGEVLRLAMLMTHYREPIDFSVRKLEEAASLIAKWRRRAAGAQAGPVDPAFVAALGDDLDMAEYLRLMNAGDIEPSVLFSAAALIGLDLSELETDVDVADFVARRLALIAEKNWAEADRIRDELLEKGIQLKDGKDPATGERVTTWEVKR